MKKIPTRTHAIVDIATAGFSLFFPRILGSNRSFTRAVTALSLGRIGYTLLTRHELGVVKVIPMRANLVLGGIGGAALAALPFIMDERKSRAVVACALGVGVLSLAMAPVSDTEYRPRRGERRIASLADTTTQRAARIRRRAVSGGSSLADQRRAQTT